MFATLVVILAQAQYTGYDASNDIVGGIMQKLIGAITQRWAGDLAFIGLFFGIAAYFWGDHDGKQRITKTIICVCALVGIAHVYYWFTNGAPGAPVI